MQELEVGDSKRIHMDHDDCVVSILQVGDPTLDKVRDLDPRYAHRTSSHNHLIEGFHRKIKHEWREWVILTNSLNIHEVVPYFVTDGNRSLAPETKPRCGVPNFRRILGLGVFPESVGSIPESAGSQAHLFQSIPELTGSQGYLCQNPCLC